MIWNRAQLQALYSNVYRVHYVCPTCGGKLNVTLAREAGVLASVTCVTCDANHLVCQKNDPLRDQFRDFSESEAKIIQSADKWRQKPICPVDGAEMDASPQRSLGRTSNVVVRCRRCGRSVEYIRLHG